MDFAVPYALEDTMRPPIVNFLQLALAIIRIDLGNTLANNFLTHPQLLNQTLEAFFPETTSASGMPSRLHSYLQQQALLLGSGSAFDAFQVPGPSVVQTVYVCKLLKRKSTGNLLVSVFVATVGMFMSGWTFFIMMAHWIVENKEVFLKRPRWDWFHDTVASFLSR